MPPHVSTKAAILTLYALWLCLHIVSQTSLPHPTSSASTLTKPSTSALGVVILAYDRPEYLRTTLTRLATLLANSSVPVFVSRDMHSSSKNSLAMDALLSSPPLPLTVLLHESPEQESPTASIARHYKFALSSVFASGPSALIVLEEDMEVSMDFFSLFTATLPILEADPSVFCVSSWNDLGHQTLASDEERIFRTDFFPGLGWMLLRSLWEDELVGQWPVDHWDWWIRQDAVMRGRECLAPEVSRNRNIGVLGATVTASSARFLTDSAVSSGTTDFGHMDLSYLYQHRYGVAMQRLMDSATRVTDPQDITVLLRSGAPPISTKGPFLVTFLLEDFKGLSTRLKIMDHPRATHHGVMVVRKAGSLILLADRRTCPYLRPEESEPRATGVSLVIGEEAQSCTSACIEAGATCHAPEMQFLSSCLELQQHFPCERGCLGGVLGEDMPNYVSSTSKPEAKGYCQTSTVYPTCDGSHWSTQRLCPCIKPPSQ